MKVRRKLETKKTATTTRKISFQSFRPDQRERACAACPPPPSLSSVIHPQEADETSTNKSGDIGYSFDFGVQKYNLYSHYIFNFIFTPTPPPSPTTSGIPMSPVTVTVTIANESSPAERRQPNKEEQKKRLLSVCFSC